MDALLAPPNLTEALIVPVALGRDFPLGVIPPDNPTIIVAARDLDMAGHLGQIFERLDRQPRLIPEDYIHTRVTPVLRARFGLPEVPTPDTIKGWHPYQRITQALYNRQHGQHLHTTATEHNGTTVYFGARPLYDTRAKIAAAGHVIASALAA